MKIFKNFKTFAIVFISLLLFSTCKKEMEVVSQVNEMGTVFGNGNEHVISEVIQTPDDQYLICGTVLRGQYGMADGYLMKVDEQFNVLWYKNFGGVKQDFFESMATDEDGNILLAGNSYSYGVSLDTNNSARNNLFYMVYTNSKGELLWQKTYQPNDTSAIPNERNEAGKVLYLKNKKYCVAGLSTNFNVDLTSDGYAFGIDNTGKIEWSSNYYQSPLPSVWLQDYEFIENAALCDDGNILLFFKCYDSVSYNYAGYLLKIPVTPSAPVANRQIWKGPYLSDISYTEFVLAALPPRVQLKITAGDKAVFNDEVLGELVFTGNAGEPLKRVKFEHKINDITIEKTTDQLIVTGLYKSDKGNFPCWAITDLDGNIKEQNYLKFEAALAGKIKIKTMLINKQNERIVFGTLINDTHKKIIMLRFDSKGNLIK